ncbi:hypothetical protein FQN54_006109 [Arachnomyces sp. PD_36]|nr:hypothetical protein FQN54_006109 [Arachnomyces sp. PD_36]
MESTGDDTLVIPEDSEAPKSPEIGPMARVKIEETENNDQLPFIKKEEDADDCVITKVWSIENAVDVDAESIASVEEYNLAKLQEVEPDDHIPNIIKKEIHDENVIENIWSINEAIDLEAIDDNPHVQTPLEALSRYEETEQDRLDQNHQLERIALARQRLKIRSSVNSASKQPQVGLVEEVPPNDIAPALPHNQATTSPGNEDSAAGENIMVEDAEVAGLRTPSSPSPQSVLERSDDLFCSDYDDETKASRKRDYYNTLNDASPTEDSPANAPPQNKRRKQQSMKISAHDRKESMRVGLDFALAKSQKPGRPKTNKSAGASKKSGTRNSKNSGVTKSKKKKSGSKGGGSGGKTNVSNGFNVFNLFRSDVIGEAQSNESRTAIPVISAKDKRKALKEISDKTEKTLQAKADRAAVKKAVHRLGRAISCDGSGGYKLKGMRTSLYYYQLLGLSFMRECEESETPPYGGFLCDEMGFGKTIQAIANVIVGAPDPEDAVNTTLIVAPRHLVSHWQRQINDHCENFALGHLSGYGVIITTYEEVRRSYPVFRPPKDLGAEVDLADWWEKEYDKKVGALHTLKFRRIILDEAHMIKNRDSSVSQAVKALTGKYRWVLSGTPAQNGAAEFFSYFEFLKIPERGPHGYGELKKEYYKGGDGCFDGLSKFIEPMMMRRTHSAELFGHPILKLPNVHETPIMVKFNRTEKLVYQILGKQFVNLINSFRDPGDVDSQYRCILTMYLRLRMCATHVLLVQGDLKDLLTPDVMGMLRNLVEGHGQSEPTDLTMFNIFDDLTTNFLVPNLYTSQNHVPPEQHTRKGTLAHKFCNFLDSLKGDRNVIELVRRCLCPVCKQLPAESYITSCMHIYCAGCLPVFEEGARIECSECDGEITKVEYCDSIEDLGLNKRSLSDILTPGGKSKTKAKAKKGPKSGRNRRNLEDENLAIPDWIETAGDRMHSAKLAATRDTIINWFSKSSDCKVVIFTQFLGMARILEFMCETKTWGYVTLTGKMPIAAREIAMKRFREDLDTRIMISSLRCGGTGLDLTMANKCILIDLWWNIAVEQQAFCRVFRHGQEKEVEIVKILVEGSTDDWLTTMQNRKMTEINKAMGQDALEKTTMLETIAAQFGTVSQDKEGLFHIDPFENADKPKVPQDT